jgi:hypothetical protein
MNVRLGRGAEVPRPVLAFVGFVGLRWLSWACIGLRWLLWAFVGFVVIKK